MPFVTRATSARQNQSQGWRKEEGDSLLLDIKQKLQLRFLRGLRDGVVVIGLNHQLVDRDYNPYKGRYLFIVF